MTGHPANPYRVIPSTDRRWNWDVIDANGTIVAQALMESDAYTYRSRFYRELLGEVDR